MLTRALVVVVLLLGLLVTATTVSPLRLQAAQSGAMAPTIGTDDAYLVGDAGSIEIDDVVVFWSPERGAFLTRRIVDRTDDGYLTRGDGADRTDQATGLSPIPRSGIVGEVVTVGGALAVLPGMGGPVSFAGRYALELLGLVIALGVGLVVRERRGRHRSDHDRRVWRIRDVAEAAFVVVLVLGVALTPLGAAGFQVTFTAAEDGDGGSRYTVPVGETVTRTLSLPVDRQPFSRVVVRSEGMTIEEWRWAGESIEVDVSIPPAEATGPRPTTVQVFPYPAVLPGGLLGTLHDVHPLVAILGSLLALLIVPMGAYFLLVDGDRPIDMRRIRRRVRR